MVRRISVLGAGLDTTANMIALGAFALLSHPDEVAALRAKAGESVTVSIPAANRDPERFADPDTLDLHRSAAGHVAFGHGIHQCLGLQLARVELWVVLPALFQRFPALRLAVPPEDVPLRNDMLIYGVHRLPVAW